MPCQACNAKWEWYHVLPYCVARHVYVIELLGAVGHCVIETTLEVTVLLACISHIPAGIHLATDCFVLTYCIVVSNILESFPEAMDVPHLDHLCHFDEYRANECSCHFEM
jgi:hypothetical protein